MSSISGPGAQVLRGFISAANAQYREAGLGEYQMRLKSDGTVATPRSRSPRFKESATGATAASDQASAGADAVKGAPAAPAASSSSSASAGSDAGRSGAAPALTAVKPTADGFALQWKAVDGAKAYGIWVDGQLMGTVPKPEFAGTLAPGDGGVVQVDAVMADGTRTALTAAMQLARSSEGKLQVSDPSSGASTSSPDPAATAAAAGTS